MKILFISRAYPPIVGGIENQNYELGKWLGKIDGVKVKIIANKKGKNFLPFFLPYAIIKTLLIAKNYDVVLLGDGVLGVLAYKLKFFYPKKKVVCVVHGLDLTYKNKFYQKFWVNIFLKKVDKFIAVGNETVKVVKEKNLGENKVVFIPNGVDTEKFSGDYQRSEIEKIINEPIDGKKFLLTSGRLAKRKGVAWFIRNVMPKLSENVTYIVAGDGPDKENIESAVGEKQMEKRVKLLGYVTDEVRNTLLNTCDLFIQPNIKVPGDMEGFGISVIEAAASKIPVVVSRLEGLQDAIKDGQDGFLIEPENPDAYVSKINELLSDDNFRKEFGEKARQYVVDNFRWDRVAQKYLDEIKSTIAKLESK